MKAKTTKGLRLKRLANRYGQLMQECGQLHGGYSREQAMEVYRKRDEAKQKLFDTIDELTSIDLTPRRRVTDGTA